MGKILWAMKGKKGLEANVGGRKFEIKKMHGECVIFINGREVGGASDMPMALQLAEGMFEPDYDAKTALSGVKS